MIASMKLTSFIFFILFINGSLCLAGDLLSPRPGVQVFHSRVLIEVESCPNPSAFDVALSATHENPFRPTRRWRLQPQTVRDRQRAWAWLELPPELPADTYTVDLSYHCSHLGNHPGGQEGPVKRELTWVDVVPASERLARYAQLGFGIIQNYTQGQKLSSMDWDWQDAVFLLGVQRFLESFQYLRLEEGVVFRHPQEDDMAMGLRSYYPSWFQRGLPSINRPDPCAPSLPGALAFAQSKDERMRPALEKVAQYIRTAPRLSMGALSHLGHNNFFSFIYPESIWVDSLVMYGLFASNWGWINADTQFHRFGMSQPLIFARILQDPSWGLFRHAWFTGSQHLEPLEAVFWLRGNGWASVSFIDTLALQQKSGILSFTEQTELEQRFRSLLSNALHWLPGLGLWNTVMNMPHETYPEVSGSALFSYSMLKGARMGYVDNQGPSVMSRNAKVIADSIIQRLKPRANHAWSVPEISGPTNPSNLAGYAGIGVTEDKGYGVGAVLLMVSELIRSEGAAGQRATVSLSATSH